MDKNIKQISLLIVAVVILTNFAAVSQQVIEFKTITEALNYTGDKTAITKIIITDYLEKEKINLLLEEFPNGDTIKCPPINFFNTSICSDVYEVEQGFGFRIHTDGYMEMSALEGPDKDLFSYTTSLELPGHFKDTVLGIYITFNPMGATPGLKTAFFNLMTITQSIKIWQFEVIARVEKEVVAKPDSVDFGTIQPSKYYNEKVLLVNCSRKDALIKIELAKNTDFKVMNDYITLKGYYPFTCDKYFDNIYVFMYF